MCTAKIQFVLWAAMETVRFHIAQMSLFFFFFFFLDGITHLVVQSEQFGSHEKLSWGSCRLNKSPAYWHFLLTYSPY